MRENHMRVRDCPISGKSETLWITFVSVKSLGSNAIGWKKSTYSCSNDNCPAVSPNECPIYLNEEY